MYAATSSATASLVSGNAVLIHKVTPRNCEGGSEAVWLSVGLVLSTTFLVDREALVFESLQVD